MGAKRRTKAEKTKQDAPGWELQITFPATKTLLTDFIEKKARGYNAPERKGTPKGETIGFGAQKFCALLSFLYKTKVKEVAEKLGVSYGVLRKWRTEAEFKTRQEDFENEFAKAWCKHFWAHHTISMSLDKISKRKRTKDLLNDTTLYSNSLKEAIYYEIEKSYLLDESITKEKGGELAFFQNLADVTFASTTLDPQGEVVKIMRGAFKEIKKRYIPRAYEELKSFINKKNPSAKARETALWQLKFILGMSS